VTNHWIDSQTFWRDKRVIVTGGAGFLGTYVVQKLHARGAAEITKVTSVIVPRSHNYDLRDINAIRRLVRDVAGESKIGNQKSEIIVIHLAARAGGIPLRFTSGTNVGANREHPAEFFYDNLMTPASTAGAA